MPYAGQHEPRELVTSSEAKEKTHVIADKKESVVMVQPERKTASQPVGKLSSNNIGIKSTLNPRVRKQQDNEEQLAEQNETYEVADLEALWKKYAYQLKHEKRDSLFSTLMNSDMKVDSNHIITLKIKNSVQSNELDAEKAKLLRYLRQNLKNTKISLKYVMEETETVSILDSKSTFEKLAEENSSLHKFRKLFNLDIEF
ncbi:MAG: hypothetical protein HUJ25_00705 [Crocinitomicaceae bacterium]|nr:hypothetical protein [Crocinitomicaceae bacterium]